MNGIWLKTPPTVAEKIWMESLPLGNGKTSMLFSGNVGCEHLLINRYDRWAGDSDPTLPDVSGVVKEMRELIAQGRYLEASPMLSRALEGNGYFGSLPSPKAPIEIKIEFDCKNPHRRYRRGIDFDKGEAFARFESGNAHIERKAFVSMADDVAVFSAESTEPFSATVYKPQDGELKAQYCFNGEVISETDEYIIVENTSHLLIVAGFGELPTEPDYNTLLNAHLPLRQKANGKADLSLYSGEGRHNEALFEETGDDGIPPELVEKLWKFGRYLFVSGTSPDGYPFPLYGLWNGEDNLWWTQHVANENVQIIYHHAAVGGLFDLVKPLIHYYASKIEPFREAARKLFGCRGIFVSVYSTPLTAMPTPIVPVIINCISCAGWLCRHFYEYYRFTQDEELFESEILPFMLETAAFYEDYLTRNNDGEIEIAPSVSPENSPRNLIPAEILEGVGKVEFGHPCPVVKNATIDFAILKELLCSLLEISKSHSLPPERIELWRGILSDIPDYLVNSDGAVCEWMDKDLDDYYCHRHLSHLYPLFPGDEIVKGDKLFSAFEKAVDMRQVGGLCGWSFPHMSAIYSRLGRGEQALSMLDSLIKYCTFYNLFTLGFDWREQGALTSDNLKVVQLDAIEGAVGAVQEMLLRTREGEVAVLPALPDALPVGKVTDWCFAGGSISFSWDKQKDSLDINIKPDRDMTLKVVYPDWLNKPPIFVEIKKGKKIKI